MEKLEGVDGLIELNDRVYYFPYIIIIIYFSSNCMTGQCVYFLSHRGIGKIVEENKDYKKREKELKNSSDILGIGCSENLEKATKKYKISQKKEIAKFKKKREKIRKEKIKNISKNKNKKSKKTKSIKKQKSKKNIFQKLFSF